MKNKRLLIYLIIGIIISVIYGFYVVCYFRNKSTTMAIDENQKEEIFFNYDELLLELSKIDDKNNTSTFFLSECKEKASWLAMNQYRKECYLLFTELNRIIGSEDPEIVAWYYSSMMMQALDVRTALDKMNYVYNAVEGFQSIPENNNFNCQCIKIETYLSLPSFFSDQIDEAFICLKKLCSDIEKGKEFTVTNNSLEQIRTQDFSYINQLVLAAEKLENISKTNMSILLECKGVIEEEIKK